MKTFTQWMERFNEPTEEELIQFFQDHGWTYGEALEFVQNNWYDARDSFFTGRAPMSSDNPVWSMPPRKKQPMSGSAAIAGQLPPSRQPSPFAKPA